MMDCMIQLEAIECIIWYYRHHHHFHHHYRCYSLNESSSHVIFKSLKVLLSIWGVYSFNLSCFDFQIRVLMICKYMISILVKFLRTSHCFFIQNCMEIKSKSSWLKTFLSSSMNIWWRRLKWWIKALGYALSCFVPPFGPIVIMIDFSRRYSTNEPSWIAGVIAWSVMNLSIREGGRMIPVWIDDFLSDMCLKWSYSLRVR